MSKTICESVA